MNEHSFVKAVHRKLPPEVYKWKIHDTYTGGVPDAMYAGPAGLLFVEYKYLKSLPKKPTTPIKTGLSALQIQWLEQMYVYKVLAIVIIGSPVGCSIVTNDFNQTLTTNNFSGGVKVAEVATLIHELTHCHEERIRLSNPRTKPQKNLGSVQRTEQDNAS